MPQPLLTFIYHLAWTHHCQHSFLIICFSIRYYSLTLPFLSPRAALSVFTHPNAALPMVCMLTEWHIHLVCFSFHLTWTVTAVMRMMTMMVMTMAIRVTPNMVRHTRRRVAAHQAVDSALWVLYPLQLLPAQSSSVLAFYSKLTGQFCESRVPMP